MKNHQNNMKLKIPHLILAVASTGLILASTSANAAFIIVDEKFDGTGNAISGTTAETFDSAITTAGGSDTWTSSSYFKDNGNYSGGPQPRSARLNLGSYLNDAKGTVTGKFDLTATISSGSVDWLSLGFRNSGSTNISNNFETFGGIGTMILQNNGDIDMFGGVGNANEVAADDVTYSGPRTLTVSLDLTSAGGYDGTSNFGTVTFSDSVAGEFGSYTYTSDQNFQSILISSATGPGGGLTGDYDALTLVQMPEPSSAALLGLGGLALMLRRKRS